MFLSLKRETLSLVQYNLIICGIFIIFARLNVNSPKKGE